MNLTSISLSLRTVQKWASEGCFCAFHWRTQGKDKVILSVHLFILSFYLRPSLFMFPPLLCLVFDVFYSQVKIHNLICVCKNTQNRKKTALIIPGEQKTERECDRHGGRLMTGVGWLE